MSEEKTVKPVLWISSSKCDLMDIPPEVVTDFGYGLYQAQLGEHPDNAKILIRFRRRRRSRACRRL